MPVRCKPKRIMTTPAMRASSDLYCASTWPTSVEIAPKVMKTMLKPMMKAAELIITLRKSWPSFIFSCSTPTPEIRETYPGTSGSTQGDRNEISPATKAASGNGRLVISFYCSEAFGRREQVQRSFPFGCAHGQDEKRIYIFDAVRGLWLSQSGLLRGIRGRRRLRSWSGG